MKVAKYLFLSLDYTDLQSQVGFRWDNSSWQLGLKSQLWRKKYATHHNLFLIRIQISVICLIISKKLWRLTERLAFTWQGKRFKSGYFLSSGLTRSLIPEALWFIFHLCIRLTRSIYENYIFFNNFIKVKVLRRFTFAYLKEMSCQNNYFSVYSGKSIY